MSNIQLVFSEFEIEKERRYETEIFYPKQDKESFTGFAQDTCIVQTITGRDKKQNPRSVTFVLFTTDKKHEAIDTQWKRKLSSVPKPCLNNVKALSKRMCQYAHLQRHVKQQDVWKERYDVLKAMNVHFHKPSKEVCFRFRFRVFSYTSTGDVWLTCLYVPSVDKLFVLETIYSDKSSLTRKSLGFNGENRRKLLHSMKLQSRKHWCWIVSPELQLLNS